MDTLGDQSDESLASEFVPNRWLVREFISAMGAGGNAYPSAPAERGNRSLDGDLI